MLGLCSVTFRNKKPKEIIRLVKEAKLDCIEWESKQHVPPTDLIHARKIGAWTNEAGLTVSSYGTYYKVGSYEDFQPFIDTAEALNTVMIRVWAGDKPSKQSDDQWFNIVLEDTHRIADLAAENNISISFEYHSGTLTDTSSSAKRLMESVKSDNVYLYWQPAENLTVQERLDSLSLLGKWLSNVHVFHWKDYSNRFSLAEGISEWKEYMTRILKNSPNPTHFLLEFVKGDSTKQIMSDAETLIELNRHVKT